MVFERIYICPNCEAIITNQVKYSHKCIKNKINVLIMRLQYVRYLLRRIHLRIMIIRKKCYHY